MAMVLHELATNAVKYGALSTDVGWVSLDWTAAPCPDGVELKLIWTEHDGPPVEPPRRKGFGARLIARSLAAEEGSAELIYAPGGLTCRMVLLIRPRRPHPKPSSWVAAGRRGRMSRTMRQVRPPGA